jgi:hypothetical protein
MPADFPAIEPTERSWTFGSFGMSEAAAVGGGNVRFSHASEAVGQVLTLTFEELTAAEVEQIRDHHNDQQGGLLSFELPAIIWQGHASTTDVAEATDRWIYNAPPEEPTAPGGFATVTVELRCVGPEIGDGLDL